MAMEEKSGDRNNRIEWLAQLSGIAMFTALFELSHEGYVTEFFTAVAAVSMDYDW